MSKVEYLNAKNGDLIAKIKGKYLHSPTDPKKEAEKIILKYEKMIEHNPYVLILGAGLGYHIKEIKEKFKDKCKFYVIEPSEEIKNFVVEAKIVEEKEIYSGSVVDTFAQENFQNFLMNVPTIIYHPSSYNIHKEWFKNFLSYKANQNSTSFIQEYALSDLSNYFLNSSWDNFNGHIKTVKNEKSSLERIEFFLLAFSSI